MQYRDTQEKLVGHLDNIAVYAIAYNYSYILSQKTSSSIILEQVSFICQEVESNARRNLKTIEERIDLAFPNRVIIQHVMIKIAQFREIRFEGRATERSGYIDFHHGCFLKDDKTLYPVETGSHSHSISFCLSILFHFFYIPYQDADLSSLALPSFICRSIPLTWYRWKDMPQRLCQGRVEE